MKPFYLILIAYSTILTILFIKSKIQEAIDEFSDSDIVRVKIWHEGRKYIYDRQSPLLFIGGMPRSGTTMLRAMVEGHPSIACGEETRVIPELVRTFDDPFLPLSNIFLSISGISGKMIEDNVAEFILKILTKHSRPNSILCNKDPYIANHTSYVRKLFPNSKHLLIIRDGRASIYSLIKGNYLEVAFGPAVKTFELGLMAWNYTMARMVEQCFKVGPEVCMILYYELLVNDPEYWLKRVAAFLNVPYADSMFNYRSLIGDKIEAFTGGGENITHDISNKSFYNWVPEIPKQVATDVKRIAPMLEVLGYDIENEVPDYSTAKMLKGYENTTLWQKNSFMNQDH